MAKFAVAAILVLLSLTGVILSSHGKSISRRPPLSPEMQERLKVIRKLSIDAGLPQTDLAEDVCYDDGCLDAAFDILSAMNGSVNPCDDFYKFSCGRWIAKNPVPPSAQAYGRYHDLLQKVRNVTTEILSESEEENDIVPIKQSKQFFRQCMDIEAIERSGLDPLKDLISLFGGWQLLNPGEWNADSFDWMKAMADLYRKTDKPAVLGVYSMAHLKNSDKQVIYIDQPDPFMWAFVLPRGVLINRENNRRLFDAYETYIFQIARELNSTQNEEQLRDVAKEIIAFEESLAKLTTSEEDRYEKDRLYNPYKLKDYQAETDRVHTNFRINWVDLLGKFFGPTGVDDIGEEEEVIVQEKEYVKNVILLLAQEEGKSSNVLANYLILRLVHETAALTTEAMRDIVFDFQKEFSGVKEQEKREETCATAAGATGLSVLGLAISTKYIEREMEENVKEEATEMVDNLKAAMGEMVVEADWMRNETNVKAIEKKDAMASLVAYPDWLKNGTQVEEFFEGLQLGSSYLQSRLAVTDFMSRKILGGLREPSKRDFWRYPPFIPRASAIPWYNTIVIHSGFLQVPFFGANRPKHQNYGGIGIVTGHEILHNFEKQGSQYDSKGNLENWWDDETKREYELRGQCLIDQYDKYCYHFGNGDVRCVNGILTQGENIGDNGGLRYSFRAYQKYAQRHGRELRLPGLERFSTEQLFFVAYGNILCESVTDDYLKMQLLMDPHSPSEWRVNGVMMNSAEFAEAYNCTAGSRMNPPEEEKCIVW